MIVVPPKHVRVVFYSVKVDLDTRLWCSRASSSGRIFPTVRKIRGSSVFVGS